MSSYRSIYFHIIFRTKESGQTIPEGQCRSLYNYIWGIVKNKNCKLFQINGVEDHLHLLTDLHPSISLAEFVAAIKANSSRWMKESGQFPEFKGWAEGYGAFTCDKYGKDVIIQYIKSQKDHHKKFNFEDEYRQILSENGVNIDERYFLKG